MGWKIHVRKDGKHIQHLAHDWPAALAVVCLMLRDGIVVERVDGPDGFGMGADALAPLCEAAPHSAA